MAYLGDNTVTLVSEHRPTGLPGSGDWERDLDQETLVIEEYFDKFRFLPVVALGLVYRP